MNFRKNMISLMQKCKSLPSFKNLKIRLDQMMTSNLQTAEKRACLLSNKRCKSASSSYSCLL